MINLTDALAIRSQYKDIERVDRKWELFSKEILSQIIFKCKLHPNRKEIAVVSNHFSDASFKEKALNELSNLGFNCKDIHSNNCITIRFEEK